MYLSSLRTDYLERFLRNHELEALTEKTITNVETLKDELETIRTQGYATDDEEFMSGMTAIAVPILDHRGRLLSTLSIHAPEQRRTVADLIANLGPLRDAAAEMTEVVSQ